MPASLRAEPREPGTEIVCGPVVGLLTWLADGWAGAGLRGLRGSASANGVAVGEKAKRSPRILAVAWGRIDVEGLGVVKDVKLYPGGGREWDWSETGMRHSPGIQPAEIEELLLHGAEVVVLSRGMDLQLQISQQALEFLEEKDVKMYVAETTEAVRIYNELVATQPVAGLFHSTC